MIELNVVTLPPTEQCPIQPPDTTLSAALGSAHLPPPRPGGAEGLIAGRPAVVRVSGAGPAGCSPARLPPPSPRPAGVPGSSPPRECRRQRERQSRNGIIDSVVHAQAVLSKESRNLLSEAQQLNKALATIDFGTIHSQCRDPLLEQYPLSLQNYLKRQYIETAGSRCTFLFGEARRAALDAGLPTDSWSHADSDLKCTHRILRDARVHRTFDDDTLRKLAKDHARFCSRVRTQNLDDVAFRIEAAYAHQHDVTPPVPYQRAISLAGCLNRLESPRWWHRAMRHAYPRRAEESLRKQGCVHRQASLYVSHEALAFRVAQRARNIASLSDATATNDLGEQFALIDLAARGTSSPIIRRTELMVRCRGMEERAKASGHVGALFVCTLPSRFHAFAAGYRNSKFDGSSPRDGQRWLCQNWQRLRARLQRLGIEFYGLRTVEPHHDGTPHWNVLVFCSANALQRIEDEFRRYFLFSESPHEPGAAERRIKMVRIDSARGGATGYIAKYISKNVDGYGVGVDFEDTANNRVSAETAVRVEAWASIHGIRQFQQFGEPPVTVWRELRRVQKVEASGLLQCARQAADDGDWASFSDAMESDALPSNGWAIDIFRIWSDKPGVFGDPVGYVTRGIMTATEIVHTRDRTWIVEWGPQDNYTRTLH